MKLSVLSVGRDRADPLVEAARAYLSRIRRPFTVDAMELKEEPLRKTISAEEVRKREGERILSAVPEGARLVALDGRGRGIRSEAWAADLERWVLEAKRTMVFVVGGPVGLSRAVLDRADEIRSLGPMTLPHRLARLIVCEQVYRAVTILNDEPYHK